MTEYVNDIFYYEESNIPIIPRVLNHMRDTISDYREQIGKIMENSGGKYLIHTHDYLYYAYKGTNKIPEVEGLCIIC